MGKIGENFGVELDKSQKQETSDRWPGGWGPQDRSSAGGGVHAMVPNLRVCKHVFTSWWHTQGEKDELTSCRVPSSRRGNTSSESRRRERAAPKG